MNKHINMGGKHDYVAPRPKWSEIRLLNPMHHIRAVIGQYIPRNQPIRQPQHNPGFHLPPLGGQAAANDGDDDDDNNPPTKDRKQRPNKEDQQPPSDPKPDAAIHTSNTNEPVDLDDRKPDRPIDPGLPSSAQPASPPFSPRRSSRLAAFWAMVEADLMESPLWKRKREHGHLNEHLKKGDKGRGGTRIAKGDKGRGHWGTKNSHRWRRHT